MTTDLKKVPPLALHTVTILSAMVIIILSLIPRPPEILHPFSFSDKIFHALAYTVLSFFAYLSLSTETHRRKDAPPTVLAALVVLFCLLSLGGGIEIIQPYFGRSRELLDFTADTIGVAGGFALALRFK